MGGEEKAPERDLVGEYQLSVSEITMTEIVYVQKDGTKNCLSAENGVSVMSVAVQRGIVGIIGECGGVLSCATCHVYVDDAWIERVGAAGDDEAEILEMVSADRRPTSRLSCQIKIRPEIDGLVVHVPPEQ